MDNCALITGGSGFIGSHLCEALLLRGHNVICLDNFHTGSKANIAHLLDYNSFELLRHDVTVPFQIEAETIYNLACPASPFHYQRDPVRTVQTNIQGAINLLEIARRSGARILQASTSEVYGDPEKHPQSEDYLGHVNTIGPRACYDEGKRCAETLFFDYHRQFDLEIKVARIFNTFGPRMQPFDGRVVSNFIVQALNNDPITVYGDGRQTRSFCFVDDLVEGLITMMEADNKICGPINLGNPVETTMWELADLVIKLTNSKSLIEYKALPEDDPKRRSPDISLARSQLKWEPKTPLIEGLKKTIDYFQSLR